MGMRAPHPESQRDLRATSLRLILLLGVASLFGSLVSNGARSVTGPYLLLLGGSAAVVGLVAGAGEFIGYALRAATGAYLGHNHRYWKVAIGGYCMLAAIPFLAFAGHWATAAALIIAERIGKAIRTPARDTILSHATVAVGRGWGFGFHKALDQVGAVAGPLVMVAVLAVTGGYTDGFLVLAIPLIGVAAALFLARSEVPSPRFLEVEEMQGDNIPSILPYALFIFLGMAGFATFPLISFHLKAGANRLRRRNPALLCRCDGCLCLCGAVTRPGLRSCRCPYLSFHPHHQPCNGLSRLLARSAYGGCRIACMGGGDRDL